MKPSELELGSVSDLARSFKRSANDPRCGIEELDAVPHFFERGEVSIVFSRGKRSRTVLGMNIAENVALDNVTDGRSVLVFSLSDSADHYCRSMIASMAGVNIWRLERGLVSKSERIEWDERVQAAKKSLERTQLVIEDELGMDVDKMIEIALRQKARGECALVIVDSLQDCSCSCLRRSVVGWGVIGSRLKRIARELNCPVLVLSGQAEKHTEQGDVFEGYGSLCDSVASAAVLKFAGCEKSSECSIAKMVLQVTNGFSTPDIVELRFDLCKNRYATNWEKDTNSGENLDLTDSLQGKPQMALFTR